VDGLANSNSDSYTWTPKITLLGDYDTSASKRAWGAEKEFGTKAAKAPVQLSAWEKFAQVMLLANETVFVD